MPPTTRTTRPLRLKISTAAKLLDMTPNAVRMLAATKVLTAIYPAGTGKGKKIYLNPDEVDAYAAGGVAGAVQYRKRLAKKTKGRP